MNLKFKESRFVRFGLSVFKSGIEQVRGRLGPAVHQDLHDPQLTASAAPSGASFARVLLASLPLLVAVIWTPRRCPAFSFFFVCKSFFFSFFFFFPRTCLKGNPACRRARASREICTKTSKNERKENSYRLAGKITCFHTVGDTIERKEKRILC